MAHGNALHRAAHLRHGAREVKVPRQDVETVVEVVFETAAQTFSGPATFVTPTMMIGNPVENTAPAQPSETGTNNENEDNNDEQPAASSEPTVISAPATVKPTASSLFTDATQPTAANPINGISSTTAAPTSSAAASEGGMSAGGTAGLVIGILLMVGVALAGILFLLKRKKQQKQQKERQPIDDDEKGNPFIEVTPAPARTAPSVRTARTASTAPRLSLRPVTEFDPALEEKRRSAANALEMASAAPTSRTLLTPTDKPALNAWERRGAEKHMEENPFSDPANPFGNHAATHDSSAPQGPLPASPSTASYASNTLVDNGDVATGAVVAAATGAAAANAARKPLPYPQDTPSQEAQRSASPVSPEEKPLSQEKSIAPENSKPQRQSSNPVWVEDVPASPGPAPTGPPPMAGTAHGPAPMADNVHRVQMDFKPSMDDELEIRAGQLVRMLHEYDDGWALCIRMDRSQQGVAPRSCLSKMPVKPRDGPPNNRRPPPPGARGPMGPGVPRPLTPNSGRNSPSSGRNSPRPMQHGRPMSPMGPPGRPRANSNAQGHPRSMSPGPYGGGQQPQRPDMGGRRRSNSAGPVNARRQSPPGPSPMNPNQSFDRKPVPGQAL